MTSPVNLLPWELRRRQLMRVHSARWGRVVLMLLSLVGAYWYQKQNTWHDLQNEAAALETRTTPFRTQDAQNEKQQQELDSLIKREDLLNQLGAPFEPLQLVSILSSRSCVRDGGIRILDLKLANLEIRPERTSGGRANARSRSRPKPAATKKEQKPVVKSELTLNGLARDDLALSEFVTSLRHTGVFESVELKSTDEVADSTGLTRAYHVRCVL